MEVRGGQDKVLGMPTTLGFNPPNRETSSSSNKLSSASLHHHHVNNTLIFNQPQTLDPFYHTQQFNPHKPSIDPAPNHNPDPNTSPAAVCTTTRATTPTASGSNHIFKPAPALAPAPAPEEVIPSKTAVRYRECLKNHAASTGGHVLDGCGEFMPSGEEDGPEGLKCAACDCHRNFHRREIEGETQLAQMPPHVITHHNKNNHSRRNAPTTASIIPSLPSPLPVHHHHQYHHFPASSPSMAAGSFPPGMMAFGGGAAESSSEDLNHLYEQSNQAVGGSRKRFRTKFSQEQKDKMMEVAEKLGWRIQKHDEQEVQQLCSEMGIKRQVFKVWMHNNKQAMKKKQL